IGAGGVTNSSNLYFASSQAATVANIIGGTGTEAKTGSGTTTLTASNTYTGPTAAASGTLIVGNLANGGTISSIGASSSAAANLVLTGGTLKYTGSGAAIDRLFSISPLGGAIDASGGGALVFNNAGADVSADAAPRVTTDSTTTNRVTFPGVLDLAVGMTVTGTNIPPATTITAISRITNVVTLSNTPTAAGTDTLSFGVLPRNLTLTGANTGINEIDGVLADSTGGGALSVTKSGSGTWSLTANNLYSGRTSINGGVLQIASNFNLGNRRPNNDVAFDGGGTLRATGTINSGGRNITVNAGGGTIDTNSNAVTFANVDGPGSFKKTGA